VKHRTTGPKVIVCQETSASEKLQPVMRKLGYRDIVYFSSAQVLARWLINRHHDGDIILVTGWREAKPCAAAIRAVRSGHVERLRPDAKMPHLTVREGNKGGMDAVAGSNASDAIGRMVVVVPNGQNPEMLKRQRAKAAKWATSEDARGLLFDVTVTTGTAYLASALEAGMQDTRTEVCLGTAAADHNTSAMDKPVAVPPTGRACDAFGTGHRLRTLYPIYLYRPQGSNLRCTQSTFWSEHANKSLALPPDGSSYRAPVTGHRLWTPSPICLYKPQSSSSRCTPSTSWLQRYSRSAAVPPDGSSYHAFSNGHRLLKRRHSFP